MKYVCLLKTDIAFSYIVICSPSGTVITVPRTPVILQGGSCTISACVEMSKVSSKTGLNKEFCSFDSSYLKSPDLKRFVSINLMLSLLDQTSKVESATN